MKKIKVEIPIFLKKIFNGFELDVPDEVANLAIRQSNEEGCFLINIALSNGAIGSSSISSSTVPKENRQEWLKNKCLEKIDDLIKEKGEKPNK